MHRASSGGSQREEAKEGSGHGFRCVCGRRTVFPVSIVLESDTLALSVTAVSTAACREGWAIFSPGDSEVGPGRDSTTKMRGRALRGAHLER